MHRFLIKVEHYNHKLIFPAVILLLFVIIFEIFIHTENYALELAIKIVDYMVIAVFVIDLIFLARKARSTKFFFKNYWLDLLAVFPFGLLFGFLGGFMRIFSASEEVVGVSQAIFHEGLETEKVVVEAERATKAGKTIRIGTRIARVVSKTHFFDRFHRRKLEQLRI